MKVIKTKFVQHEQKYHHTNGDTDGQTHDIDKGKNFALYNISPGGYKIIFKHRR
jgi:hypothetical protein